jgi:nucleotide-binding universal stress UspA family protein
MFKKILLPVDLAEPKMSDAGIHKGLALARLWDSSLRLVYVQMLLPVAFADYVPTDLGDRLRMAAEERILEFADGIDYAQERISTAVRFGAAYSEILAEADEWGADLIAMSSHRPGATAFFLGSNAAFVVGHAKCSVLIIRE